MSEFSISTAWLWILAHLWQTTLVLGAVFLLSALLRFAPARFQERLYWIALAKILLPLSIGGAIARAVAVHLCGRGSPIELAVGASTVGAWLDPVEALSATLPWAGRLSSLAAILALSIWGSVTAWRLTDLSRRWRAATLAPSRLGFAATGDVRGAGRTRRVRLTATLQGTAIPPGAIRIDEEAQMPQVRGLLRPLIVLPPLYLDRLSPDELRPILLHEDAHRRRRDPLRRLVLRIGTDLLWFYPPVHWVHRRLLQAAEFACDEAVLRSGVAAGDYARALARAVQLGLAPTAATFSAGIGEGTLLRRRFDRLTEPWRYRTMKRHALALGLALLLVAAGSLIPLPERVQAGDSSTSTSASDQAKDEQARIGMSETPPEPIHAVAPDYPEEERAAGVEGMVVIQTEVLSSGQVGAVEATQEVEGHPAFTASALEAVRQWAFRPALKDGKPVTVTVMIPFRYALDGDKDGGSKDRAKKEPSKDEQLKSEQLKKEQMKREQMKKEQMGK